MSKTNRYTNYLVILGLIGGSSLAIEQAILWGSSAYVDTKNGCLPKTWLNNTDSPNLYYIRYTLW